MFKWLFALLFGKKSTPMLVAPPETSVVALTVEVVNNENQSINMIQTVDFQTQIINIKKDHDNLANSRSQEVIEIVNKLLRESIPASYKKELSKGTRGMFIAFRFKEIDEQHRAAVCKIMNEIMEKLDCYHNSGSDDYYWMDMDKIERALPKWQTELENYKEPNFTDTMHQTGIYR